MKVGGLSGVSCAHSYILQSAAGWSMMALARGTLLCCRWSPGLQRASTGLFTWQLWGSVWKVGGLMTSVVRTDITSVLPHSICQNKSQGQPRFKWWETLHILMGKDENHLAKKADTWRGIIVAFLANNIPEKLYLICSLLCPKHLEQGLAYRCSRNISWMNEWPAHHSWTRGCPLSCPFSTVNPYNTVYVYRKLHCEQSPLEFHIYCSLNVKASFYSSNWTLLFF